jgi:hypothetical protein
MPYIGMETLILVEERELKDRVLRRGDPLRGYFNDGPFAFLGNIASSNAE